MVAVAADGVAGVGEVPVLEVEVVVEFVFADEPAVEHFVHDEEAHAVAEVEEFGSGRVVGGADGVDAEGFEGGEAVLPGLQEDSDPERGPCRRGGRRL